MPRKEPRPLHEWTQCSSNACARSTLVRLEYTLTVHGAPHQITIDYTATSDSYSTFVTAHFPPQDYEKKLVQATKIRESALHMLSWKDQNITREQLELKAQRGSRKRTFCGRRRPRRYSPGSYLCCTSVLSNALRVNDGPRC